MTSRSRKQSEPAYRGRVEIERIEQQARVFRLEHPLRGVPHRHPRDEQLVRGMLDLRDRLLDAPNLHDVGICAPVSSPFAQMCRLGA